ncbi:LOW QUALITY PROTEIN: hypothetical protein JCM19046_4078 [Bacillus sp. JCM 19046]|nr:LOW QUALITY PROTEIN: hypothetical protein JCM19046_4078 [Bacillus sp. JCM 19046]
MALIQTNKWMERYIQYGKNQANRELYLKLFISPLQALFSYPSDGELANYLNRNGMFTPDDIEDVKMIIEQDYWSYANEHFLYLKKRWNGPNVPVYLLLASKKKARELANVGGKMALSFADGIVLFIQSDIERFDLLALLTHEYHHVCRLTHTNEKENTITFLESIIMEGLAELAVQEELGERYCAPWTELYKETWKKIWEERFITERLMQTGRKNYKDILYGHSKKNIPPMLGYYYGYLLCNRAAERLQTNTQELLTTPSEKIYKWGLGEEKRV